MRRSRSKWKEIIGQYEQSGLSQTEFAKQHEVPVGTLNWWVRKLERETSERVALLPVRVVNGRRPSGKQVAKTEGAVEVMRVRFAAGTASDLMVEVISRLGSC